MRRKFKLDKLKAPVKKGDKVGKLVIEKDGKNFSETPLTAKKDVPQASFWQLYKRAFGMFTKTGN